MANIVYQCSNCKRTIQKPPTPVWLCECGKPLYARYKWEGNSRDLLIDKKNESLWRYVSVLPKECLNENISLGEGWTPLISIGNNVYIKNETVNPTGSFKDRGMAMACLLYTSDAADE